jgi:Tol biopolymer transport system component
MASGDEPVKHSSMTEERWQRICRVLDRVLDAGPAVRDAAFAEACRTESVSPDEAARFVRATRYDPEFLKQLPPALVTAALEPLANRPSLPTGVRLGPYEVIALIGTGGMGEVYRAHDTSLDRDVALKVLPETFITDPDRVSRFEREAKMLASLNHPHIGAIYGRADGGGFQALVLELVEGPTLAERLARGRLSVAESLGIASQIADALEAAHNEGLIHRDLKPANIKLRPDGFVKVLDFGLAKALAARVSEADSESLPTLHLERTQAGVVLGTAAYMSPEQARGTTVDQRSDIWAFGSVLYEMLTGVRVFPGAAAADTLGLVLMSEPDWEKLPADTPAAIHRLLRRCLEKDRRRRLAHIADARLEIEDALRPDPTALPAVAGAIHGRRAVRRWAAAGAVAAAAVAIGWYWAQPVPDEGLPVTRFAIPLPSNIDVPAVSADGSQVAFLVRVPTRRLMRRRLDGSEAAPIPGTEDATSPAFSPGGDWIAYRTTIQMEGAGGISRLKKIPASGGTSVTVVDSVEPAGGPPHWGRDDYIYYEDGGRMLRVPSAGGRPQTLLTPDRAEGELAFSRPRLLPGGTWLLVTARLVSDQAPPRAVLVALNLRTRERRMITALDPPGPLGAADYVPSRSDPSIGHLLYVAGGSLFAVPFDANRVATRGSAVRVLEAGDAVIGRVGAYDVSANGTLVYVANAGIPMQPAALVWVDRRGAEEPVAIPRRPYSGPRISPDGRRMAVSVLRRAIGTQSLADVWTYAFLHGQMTRVTFDEPTIPGSALWSADGKNIIYASRHEQSVEFRKVSVEGDAAPVGLSSAPLVGGGDVRVISGSISPDGTYLVGTASLEGRPFVWGLPIDASGPVGLKAILDTSMVEGDPRLSPNGRWIAYRSNRSGRPEIWVTPYPSAPGRWQQLSMGGGESPRWSADGRELFYRNRDTMMAVDVDTGPVFRAGVSRPLFEGRYEADYDIAPDGSRFLMIKPGSDSPRGGPDAPSSLLGNPTRQLQIVVSWSEELRRLVPLDR